MQLINVEKNKGNAVYTLSDVGSNMLELAIQDCFTKERYRMTKSTGDAFTFERGKLWVRLLAGAFAKYFKFTVTVQSTGGTTVVYLDKKGSGFSGGLIGVAQLNKEFKRMTDVLENCLRGL